MKVMSGVLESPASDLVSVSGTISGTLTVTNAGAALLAVGDSFTLFNKAVSGFTTVTLPVGYAWDNQLATSGTITVLSITFPTTPTNITTSVSGGNLTISWPANYAGGWVLETSPVFIPQLALLALEGGGGPFDVEGPLSVGG